MNGHNNLRNKILIGLAVSIGLAGILAILAILSLRFSGSGGEGGAGSGQAAKLESGAGGESGRGEPSAAEEKATPEEKTEAGSEAQEAEPPPRNPLLKGRVWGEEGGLAGAQVLLFSVREVEAFLRRLESLDPGSGFPDIPKIIAVLKEELERFKNSAKTTRADEKGEYAFFDLPPAGYFILALAKGHVFRYGEVVSLASERTVEHDIFLDRGAAISGKVVSGAGSGIEGATVTAEYAPPGMGGLGKIVQKLLKYVNGEFLKGPFQAKSDAEGNFAIDSLPPGIYDLLAEKGGFPESRLPSVPTGTSEAAILLQPGVAVRGILVSSASLPAAGVTVRLAAQAQEAAIPFPGMGDLVATANRILGERELLAVSGEKGAFELANIAPGRYQLEIQEAGYLKFQRPVEVPAGRVLDLGVLRLDSGESISGTVRTPAGEPIAGASVSAFPEGINFLSMGGAVNDMVSGRNRTETDAAGRFQLQGLGRGAYRVIAQARGHGGALQEKVPAGGDPLVLVLEPGIEIRGQVVDEATGEGIAAARVSAGGVHSQTDAEGKFLLDGVAPRSRQLNPFGNMGPMAPGMRVERRGGGEAGGPGASPAAEDSEKKIRVRATKEKYQEGIAFYEAGGEPREIRILLKLKPRVHGLVKDARGDPVAGALLRLIPAQQELPPFMKEGIIFFDTSVSNLEGKFALEALNQDGPFAVLASHPLYSPKISDGFRPEEHGEEEPIEIQLAPGGTVRGEVHDGTRGLAGALVRLAKSKETTPQAALFANMFGLPKEGDVTYSSSSGSFLYQRVPPGNYVLTAENPGFSDTKSETFTLAEGETKELRLVMDPGGEIAGTVRDQNDQLVAGARVRAIQEGGKNQELIEPQRFLGGGLKSATTDESGQFWLQGLPHGSYLIIAGKTGYTPAEAAGVKADGRKPLRLVLAAEARLRGQVIDVATGAPVPNFEIRIAPASGEASSPEKNPFSRFKPWQEIHESEGRFFENGLAGGEYRVEVRAGSYVPEARTVSLQPGTDWEIAFALARSGRLAGRVVDAVTGLPVAGARLRLAPPPPPPPSAEESSKKAEEAAAPDPQKDLEEFFQDFAFGQFVTSAEDGSFLLDSFPAEPRVVVSSHEDYIQEHSEAMTIGLGEEKELKVLLKKGFSIAGKVLEGSAPAPGGFILVRGAGEMNRRIRKAAQCDLEGAFQLRGLQGGPYLIIVPSRHGRSPPTTLPVELEESDASGLEIRLPPAP